MSSEAINENVSRLMEEFDVMNQALETEQEALIHAYELKKLPLYVKRREVIQQIPSFWLTTFENHPMLSALLDEDSGVVFARLTDVWVERDAENSTHVKLSLTFGENEYFKDEVMTKEIRGSKDLDNLTVTPAKIQWKTDKQLDKNEDSIFHALTNESEEIIQILANDVFPNALSYFVGEEGEEEEEDSEDMNGDLSEELESEEEAQPQKKRKT